MRGFPGTRLPSSLDAPARPHVSIEGSARIDEPSWLWSKHDRTQHDPGPHFLLYQVVQKSYHLQLDNIVIFSLIA